MVLEKALESPLNCKEIQPVHSEGNQPWDFFGRNDAKAETPVLLPGESHGGRSLVGYSPWGRKESDTTERLHFSGWEHNRRRSQTLGLLPAQTKH